jgi:hypothetical protein
MTRGKDAPLSVTAGYGLNTFYEGRVVTVAVNGTRAIELGIVEGVKGLETEFERAYFRESGGHQTGEDDADHD